MKALWPVCHDTCADCGIGTSTLGEYYMVHDHVWEQAWIGRLKPWHELDGQQVLCIGCLEKRIGRILTRFDFIDAPINDLSLRLFKKSKRLRNRLTTDSGRDGKP